MDIPLRIVGKPPHGEDAREGSHWHDWILNVLLVRCLE